LSNVGAVGAVAGANKADCGKLLSSATELANEFKTKLADEDQTCVKADVCQLVGVENC